LKVCRAMLWSDLAQDLPPSDAWYDTINFGGGYG